MKLLINKDNSDNHLNSIIENLKIYDEVFIAVAFLKTSGLTLLIKHFKELLKRGGKITIVAGQNFALTEPSALNELRKLFIDNPNSKIFLAKASPRDRIFHPKLYLFRNKTKCCIISGSANITNGGLTENQESSIIINCSISDKVYADTNVYFKSLTSNECSDEATLLFIKQYETYFEQQKNHNKQTKSFPTKTRSQIDFDYANLLKHFKQFDDKERDEKFENKIVNYREAKKILNQIADNPRITQKQFEPLLDKLVGSSEEYNLWHSGSLYRLRKKVYPYYKEFRELILIVRDNKNKSPEIVFELAKNKVLEIKGAAVNYITEIMMTFNEKEFANMNRNPITVLKEEGGVNLKAHSSSFSPRDYAEYCELVKEISNKLGLRNMFEADSFFNDIYWKIPK